jgi:hypothetical protein
MKVFKRRLSADLQTTDDVRACSICGGQYNGSGNEAAPVKDGLCCDDCYFKHVIFARLTELRAADREVGPPRQRWRLH